MYGPMVLLLNSSHDWVTHWLMHICHQPDQSDHSSHPALLMHCLLRVKHTYSVTGSSQGLSNRAKHSCQVHHPKILAT